MNFPHFVLRRLRAIFRRNKLESEMTEEMRFHLETQTELNLRAGMTPKDARLAARREFGGVDQIQEQARDQRGGLWLDHLARDVRHGWRMMIKAPLLSAVIIISLGIGVGVNAVVFAWIRGLIFRPLPGVENATNYLLVEPRTESGSYPGMSWLEFRDLQQRLPEFSSLFAFEMVPLNLGTPGHDDRVHAQFVSGNYFQALGLQPALGRFLRDDEGSRPGGAPVTVISYGLWQSQFGGSAAALGQTLRLNDQLLTIVGVAPDGFQGTVTMLNFDLWVPATMTPVLMKGSRDLETRDVREFSVMGRLRDDVSLAQAKNRLTAAMADLARLYPASNAGVDAEILPFWRAPRGAPKFLVNGLFVLQAFTILVLLVVCANAANLLLARGTTRRREIGIRLALGARPRQILRLMLTESLVLGVPAAALGVLLAEWGTEALRAVPLPGAIPFRFHTELEAAGLIFSVGLALGCAVLFGLAAAVQAARTDSQLTLRAGPTTPGRHRLRRVLVATEVALALLVLVGAALFLRSFMETRTANPGFKQEGVLLAAYDLGGRGYDKASGLTLVDDLLRRLRAQPSVESVAIASWVPLDVHAVPVAGFKFEGRERSDGGLDRALTFTVTPGYFDLMGIPLVAGQDFAALTDTAHGLQAIVNEEFVRRYCAGGSALGRKIQGKNAPYEIVGVVRNSLYETFGEPAKAMLYFSYRDRFAMAGQIHVRTRGAESALAPNLRRIVNDINPAVSLYDVRSLNEHVDKNLFFRRIPARLFAVLGPLILFLAAIGIYAVVAYGVAQRRTEIGVRLALGASTGRVVREIVRDSMRGVLIGAVPAWIISILVMLHLAGGALSLSVLVGVPALLLGVAWLASWLPARQAAQVDPVVALRAE